MDIRNTKRQKAFDRLLYMIVRKITDPSVCANALREAKKMFDEKGKDPNADNGGHAHTVPGIKTAIITKYSEYFVKNEPSTYDKLLAQCEAQIKKDTP